jgi:hypothetical protein
MLAVQCTHLFLSRAHDVQPINSFNFIMAMCYIHRGKKPSKSILQMPACFRVERMFTRERRQ